MPGVAVDAIAPEGGRRAFGNMILSRLPVLQVLRIQLPRPIDPAVRSMPRMALEALLETPFGPLRVMTSQLEYYSAAQRAAQVEALRARHAEACAHARAPGPRVETHGPFHSQPETFSAILTGDFNFRPTDPLHARLTAPFDDATVPALEDVWQGLHPGIAHPPTAGVFDREQWAEAFTCDFIYASATCGRACVPSRSMAAPAASDHQPVMVELA